MEKNNDVVQAMEIGFREVEALFGARKGIGDDRRVAFRGRLEHLRRLGCPVGVQTGKGKRAVFGWKQIIETAFALELVDLGINPENAARVVTTHEGSLCRAAAMLVAYSDVDLATAIRDRAWPLSRTIFLEVAVDALSGLKADGSPSRTSFGPVAGADLLKWFEDHDPVASSFVLVNLGTLIADLANFIVGFTAKDNIAVASDLAGWGEGVDVVYP